MTPEPQKIRDFSNFAGPDPVGLTVAEYESEQSHMDLVPQLFNVSAFVFHTLSLCLLVLEEKSRCSYPEDIFDKPKDCIS